MVKPDARAQFAARLKSERLSAGLTQEALGVLAGLEPDVARTRINRYERAVHDCDLITAKNIADALHVPLATLYTDSPLMAEVVKAFSRLSIREQEDELSDLVRRTSLAAQRD